MKVEEKKEALRLRLEDQLSLREISKRTGLSKSTLSLLLRDHPLTLERVKELSIGSQLVGALANKKAGDERKRIAQEEGRLLIKERADFRALCLLYWGEGSKYKGNNSFSLANSDPDMIGFICRILTNLGYVDKIKATAHCYDSFSDTEIVEYWKKYIPLDCKVYRVKNSSASLNKKSKTIPYGTLRLDIHESHLYHKVLGGIEAFKGR